MKYKTNEVAVECVAIIRKLVDRQMFSQKELAKILGVPAVNLNYYLAHDGHPTAETANFMIGRLRRLEKESEVPVTIQQNEPVTYKEVNGEVVALKVKETSDQKTIFDLTGKLNALLKEIENKQAEYEAAGQKLIDLHESASRLQALIDGLREIYGKGA